MKIGKGAIQRRNGLERKIIGFLFLVCISMFLLIFLVPFLGSILFLSGIKKNLNNIVINQLDLTQEDAININMGYLGGSPLFSIQAKDVKIGLSTSRNEQPLGYLYSNKIDIQKNKETSIACNMSYAVHNKRREIPEEFLLKIENHILFTFQGTIFFKINKRLPGISIPVVFPYTLGLFIGNSQPKYEKLVDRVKEPGESLPTKERASLPINVLWYKMEETFQKVVLFGAFEYINMPACVSANLPAIGVNIFLNGSAIGHLDLSAQELVNGKPKNSLSFKITHTIENIIHLRRCLEDYFEKKVLELTFDIEKMDTQMHMPFSFHYEVIKQIASIYINRIVRSEEKKSMQIKDTPLFEMQINDVNHNGFVCRMVFNEEIFPYTGIAKCINSGNLLDANIKLVLNDETTLCGTARHYGRAEHEINSKADAVDENYRNSEDYLTICSSVFFPFSFNSTEKVLTKLKKEGPIIRKVEISIDKKSDSILNILLCSLGLRWRESKGMCVGFTWIDPQSLSQETKPHCANYKIDVELAEETNALYNLHKRDENSENSDDRISYTLEPSKTHRKEEYASKAVPFIRAKIDMEKKDEIENFVRVKWSHLNIVYSYRSVPVTIGLIDGYIDILAGPSTSEWSIRSDKLLEMYMFIGQHFTAKTMTKYHNPFIYIYNKDFADSVYTMNPISIKTNLSPPDSTSPSSDNSNHLDSMIFSIINNTSTKIWSSKRLCQITKTIGGSLHIKETAPVSKKKMNLINRLLNINIHIPGICIVAKSQKTNIIGGIVKSEPAVIKLSKVSTMPFSLTAHSKEDSRLGSDFKVQFSEFMLLNMSKMDFIGVNNSFFPLSRSAKIFTKMYFSLISTQDEKENKTMKKSMSQVQIGKADMLKKKINLSVNMSMEENNYTTLQSTFLYGGSPLITGEPSGTYVERVLSLPGVYLRVFHEDKMMVHFDLNYDIIYKTNETGTSQVKMIMQVSNDMFNVLTGSQKPSGSPMECRLGYINSEGVSFQLFKMTDLDPRETYLHGIRKWSTHLKNDKKAVKTQKKQSMYDTFIKSMSIKLGCITSIIVQNGDILVNNNEKREDDDPLQYFSISAKKKKHNDSLLLQSMYSTLLNSKTKFTNMIKFEDRDLKTDRVSSTIEMDSGYRKLTNVDDYSSMLPGLNCVNVNVPFTASNGILDEFKIGKIFSHLIGSLDSTKREIGVDFQLQNFSICQLTCSNALNTDPIIVLVNEMVFTHNETIPFSENSESETKNDLNNCIKTNLSFIFPHLFSVSYESQPMLEMSPPLEFIKYSLNEWNSSLHANSEQNQESGEVTSFIMNTINRIIFGVNSLKQIITSVKENVGLLFSINYYCIDKKWKPEEMKSIRGVREREVYGALTWSAHTEVKVAHPITQNSLCLFAQYKDTPLFSANLKISKKEHKFTHALPLWVYNNTFDRLIGKSYGHNSIEKTKEDNLCLYLIIEKKVVGYVMLNRAIFDELIFEHPDNNNSYAVGRSIKNMLYPQLIAVIKYIVKSLSKKIVSRKKDLYGHNIDASQLFNLLNELNNMNLNANTITRPVVHSSI
ncbi:hypothetical protein NEMIN01_0780 [Nematocida minor]|uniref:uncharacterized protein n=1 Tax=Nematocida minor TaxID=1912983 RepID=UPI002220DEB9|nr:uncharacterized protein NEMIN01_0780 [Nematocida minor]KAI5189917.1 hypothetical protein NEMIN01_0780 [Nematocida minor]